MLERTEMNMMKAYYEARVKGATRAAIPLVIAGFIAGVGLTQAFSHLWPYTAASLLTLAMIAGAVNTAFSYRRMVKSRRAYKESLDTLRTINPQAAAEFERIWP